MFMPHLANHYKCFKNITSAHVSASFVKPYRDVAHRLTIEFPLQGVGMSV